MKKFLIISIIVLIMSTSIGAQNEKLVLTYNGGSIEIPLKTGSNVEILSSNGYVTAETDNTALDIGVLLGLDGTLPDSSVSITSQDSVIISDVDTTTLNWTIADASSCTKVGDWASTGSLSPTNGSISIGPFTGPDSKVYTINCTNGIDSSTSTVSVTVTDPNGTNCAAEQPPILSGSEDTTLLANGGSVGDLYDGTFKAFQVSTSSPDWPGIINQNIRLALTPNQYVAASFTTNLTTYNSARLQFTAPSNNEGSPAGGQTVSISECPGDFTTHLNQPACKTTLANIKWSTDPNQAANHCKLEKEKNYYLNIVHSNNNENNNYSTTDCTNSHCGILANMVF